MPSEFQKHDRDRDKLADALKRDAATHRPVFSESLHQRVLAALDQPAPVARQTKPRRGHPSHAAIAVVFAASVACLGSVLWVGNRYGTEASPIVANGSVAQPSEHSGGPHPLPLTDTPPPLPFSTGIQLVMHVAHRNPIERLEHRLLNELGISDAAIPASPPSATSSTAARPSFEIVSGQLAIAIEDHALSDLVRSILVP